MLAYIQSSLTPLFANSCLMTYIMTKGYIFHTLLRSPVFLRIMFHSHKLCHVHCHIRDPLGSIHEGYQGDNFV